MNAIVAIDKNYAIGKDNDLLFRISADLKNFKKLTTDKVIVYGYNTLQTFPNQKPLKNRINIIITSKNIKIEGAIIVHNLKELFKELKKYNDEDIFIIGGESVYKQLIPYCSKCFLTKVYEEPKVTGNKFFPNIDNWDIINCTIMKDGIYDYTYSILENPNTQIFKED